ncbi:MAG: DUF3822 family protein [Sediminicola sp.]
MTIRKNNSVLLNTTSEYNKLSIQISLNGLSFCVLDTIDNKILASERIHFEKEVNPFELQNKLKEIFQQYQVAKATFSEVIAIHRNQLFTFVPLALYNTDQMANYLKFNAKILANDLLAHDELESHEMVNVYVPFMNINNYIYDLFGEFEFKHSATIMVESLLNAPQNNQEPTCYVYVDREQMDITILSQKKLLLFNSYEFRTKEDFMYYLLFTLEQLKMDTETIKLKLFGTIEEGDPIYALCYKYVKHITIFIPGNSVPHLEGTKEETIDFTVLNTL